MSGTTPQEEGAGDAMDKTLVEKVISTPRADKITVHVQGNLKQAQFVIMTVHDLGCNHTMWLHFLSHPSMEEIIKRSAFIHVDIPGQEDQAKDLPPEHPPKNYSGLKVCYTFPSIQSLGEDLVCVLDQLDVKQVVGIGEGAGANILARFAIAQPRRVMGVCLIHCAGSTASFMESVKDKVINWKLEQIGMNPTAEAYLVLHRFGSSSSEFEKAQNKDQLNKVIEQFQESLRSNINPKNLKRFVQSYMKRSNIMEAIGKMKCPVLMVTGAKASFNSDVKALFNRMRQSMDKKQVDFLEVDGVANVIEEKPERFAESFLYFLQGVGLIGGVPMPRVARSNSVEGGVPMVGRSRSMSMEEADQPRGAYSFSPPKFGSTPPLSASPPTSNKNIPSSPQGVSS